MGWRFDSPLYSLADDDQNEKAKQVWEGESLGGIAEDNNRVPRPVVWLLGLTVLTAFCITFPLWGQRPTAAIYAEYVKLMDDPQVQAIADDAKKMEYIVNNVKEGRWRAHQERHPIDMNDLCMIKGQIIELERQGADLEEYLVIGPEVVLATFEGNLKPDGTRERKQPWWDKGYTIDVFYVIYFCLAVVIVIKRLPPNSWMPDHSVAH